MKGVTKKTVGQIALEKRRRREVSLALAVIFAVLLAFFGISAINETLGDFTINMSYLKRNDGVSIYDNRELLGPTTRLAAQKSKLGMTNITYSWLPRDIDDFDGSHNGFGVDEDLSPAMLYFAYTFYIQNTYLADGANYTMTLNVIRKTKNADKAMRVILIEDSEYYGHTENKGKTDRSLNPEGGFVAGNAANRRVSTIYAAPVKDTVDTLETCNADRGQVDPDENGKNGDPDKNFASENVIFEFDKTGDGTAALPCGLPQGIVFKYTLIVYLEGWDIQCDENIMGGSVKMELNISVWDPV